MPHIQNLIVMWTLALLIGWRSLPSASPENFLLLPILSLCILSFPLKLAKPNSTVCLGFGFLFFFFCHGYWKTGRRSVYDFLLAFNEILHILCLIFFLLTLTSEACFSTPSCTAWLICECFYKSNGRWEINIYIPLLGPGAFCLISLVGTSPLDIAFTSCLHPGQYPIQAHTIICVLLEHVPRKSPTWVISLSQAPCLLPRRPAAWGGSTNCHMGIFLTVVSCQPGACQSLLRQCSPGCAAWFAARLTL